MISQRTNGFNINNYNQNMNPYNNFKKIESSTDFKQF